MNAKTTPTGTLKALATGAALMLYGLASHAAPVYTIAEDVLPSGLGTLQTARAGWAAAHGGPLATEGFEGLAAVPPSPFDFGAFTMTYTAADMTLYGANALVRTEGVQGLGFSGRGTVTFTFDSPITAFGIDWSSFDQTTTVVEYSDDAGGALADVFLPVTSAGAGFLGVINNAGFTTVTFQVTQTEILEFDNIQWGTSAVIPEPMSLLLVGAGLAMVGVSRARKAS